MRYKMIACVAVLILAVFCFAAFDPGFHGADEPVYFAYTKSIVDDLDLNILNEVHAPGDRFYVTRTFNLPSLHNHGGVLFWAPFFVYGRAAANALHGWGAGAVLPAAAYFAEKCAMSLSTVIAGLGLMIITFFLARRFYPAGISFVSVAALALGTPLLYYMLIETGNANIVAGLFMAAALLTMVSMNEARRGNWFLFGMFYSLCLTVKIDLWFLWVCIILHFIVEFRIKGIQPGALAWFSAGAAPVLALKFINDYLKYGVFHSGEAGLINPMANYFFEQLFSPYRGYFYSSPILFLAVAAGTAAAVFSFRRSGSLAAAPPADRLCVILIMYLFVKLAVCSFRYAWGGGNAGARQLLADIPVFVMLYGRALSGAGPGARTLILSGSGVCVLWNFLTLGDYYAGIDLRNAPLAFNFLAEVFLPRLERMRDIFAVLTTPKCLVLKAWLLFPLIVGAAAAGLLARNALSRHPADRPRAALGALRVCLAYLACGYFLLTGMNAYHNPRNSRMLDRSGLYRQAVIVGPEEYEGYERETSFAEMIEYFNIMNDERRVQQQLRIREALHGGS